MFFLVYDCYEKKSLAYWEGESLKLINYTSLMRLPDMGLITMHPLRESMSLVGPHHDISLGLLLVRILRGSSSL